MVSLICKYSMLQNQIAITTAGSGEEDGQGGGMPGVATTTQTKQ